jgi:hypothetical protein
MINIYPPPPFGGGGGGGVKCSSMYARTYIFFHVWKIVFEGIMKSYGLSLPTEMSVMPSRVT